MGDEKIAMDYVKPDFSGKDVPLERSKELKVLPTGLIDKLYVGYKTPLDRNRFSKDLIDEAGTRKLNHSSRRKMFSRSPNRSFVVKHGEIRIANYSNSKDSESQFNPTQISLKAIDQYCNHVYGNLDGRISRIDIALDFNCTLDFLTTNMQVMRKKTFCSFSSVETKVSYDSVAGEEYVISGGGEYYGKYRQVAIYDSGKKHGFGKDVSRIEIRYMISKLCPVKYLHLLPALFNINPFYDLRLPLSVDKRTLSLMETIDDSRFETFRKLKSASKSSATMMLRKRSKLFADRLSRARKKSESDYFDFQKVFQLKLIEFLCRNQTLQESEIIRKIRPLHYCAVTGEVFCDSDFSLGGCHE